MGNQPTNKHPLSNMKQKMITIANKLVLSILFSPVSTTATTIFASLMLNNIVETMNNIVR